MIRVCEAEQEALIAFMTAHAPFLMFPLTNVLRYGLDGSNPLSMTAWIAMEGDVITDVLTISAEGVVFPWCPNGNWHAVADVLKGRQIKGFIGEGEQVAALRRAVGLTRAADRDVVEPAFALTLTDLVKPDTDGFTLHQLSAAPLDLVIKWRAEYQVETLGAPVDRANEWAEREIKAYSRANSHRVLFHNDVPVAMTGFSAQLPEIVLIGGVYTPHASRSQGFARVALAMHLMEASSNGVAQAILAAANEAAVRAYTALGFQRTGSFAVALHEDKQVAHG